MVISLYVIMIKKIIIMLMMFFTLNCSSAFAAFVADDYLGTVHGLSNGFVRYTGNYFIFGNGALWGNINDGMQFDKGDGYFYIFRNGIKYRCPSLHVGGEINGKDIYRVNSDRNETFYIVTTASSDKRSALSLEMVGVYRESVYRYVDAQSFDYFIRAKYQHRGSFDEIAYGKITGVWAEGTQIKLLYEAQNGFSDYIYMFWDNELNRFAYR